MPHEVEPAATDDLVDPRDRPIEPGRPDPEHAAFVILGALGTIFVFLRGLGVV